VSWIIREKVSAQVVRKTGGPRFQASSSLVRLALLRQIDSGGANGRNALTGKVVGLTLAADTIGTVVDTFGIGDAFLVEFGSRSADDCDWLGILYASELQLISGAAEAA
jgi:hypothetical protein